MQWTTQLFLIITHIAHEGEDILYDCPTTYRHLHMARPFVVLHIENFKKVLPLGRQPVGQQNKESSHVAV